MYSVMGFRPNQITCIAHIIVLHMLTCTAHICLLYKGIDVYYFMMKYNIIHSVFLTKKNIVKSCFLPIFKKNIYYVL